MAALNFNTKLQMLCTLFGTRKTFLWFHTTSANQKGIFCYDEGSISTHRTV